MQNEGQSISKKVCFNMNVLQSQSTSVNATTIKLTGPSSSSTATTKTITTTPSEHNSKMSSSSSSGCKNINSVSKNNFNINNTSSNSGSVCVDGEKSKNFWFAESNEIMDFIDNKDVKEDSKSLRPVSTSSLCQQNNTGQYSVILDSESEEEEEEDSVSEMDDGDEANADYDEDDVEGYEDIASDHDGNAPSHANGLLPIFNEIPLVKNAALALDEAAQALHRMRTDNPRDRNKLSRSLLSACADNDISTIKKLLGKGNSSLADSTEEGESLLSLACSAGYYELVQVLLSMNANVDDRDIKNDCTPLMEASSAGHVNVIKLLLEHNADLNAQSSIGYTPLMYTCSGGHVEAVKELLKNGAHVEFPNKNGHTPLMEAAYSGHVEVVKVLFERGTGTKTQSKEFKESALTLACQKGHLNVVQFLLEAESDHEHKTVEMHTALMEASMHGHVEVVKLLLDSGAPVNMPTDSFEPLLNLVACGGHVSLAMLLIDRGANIEEINGEGYTPLMEASKEGHEEMVALLINRNANINAQTEETQETALTLACCGGFFEIIRYLVKVGADIELGASSPLMEAAQEGHIDIIKFLLETGANAHTQSQRGDTALTYACENGHTAVAEVLLNAGAQLEHDSGDGQTPLMKACRAGHLTTVKYLVGKGANVNQQTTSNDHTPLSLACAGGHHLVVDLLLNSGANPYHKLKDNSTMLIESAKGGHTETFERLLKHPQTVGNRKMRSVKETIQKVNDCKSIEQSNEVITNQQIGAISDTNKKLSHMPQQQQRTPPHPSSPSPITIFQQRQAPLQQHPSLTPKLTSQQQQKIDQLNQLVHHHLSPMQQQQTQNLQTSQQVLQKQLLQTAHMKSSLIQVQESINRAQQQQQQKHQQLLQLQQQQVPQSPSRISSISRQQPPPNQVNAIHPKPTTTEQLQNSSQSLQANIHSNTNVLDVPELKVALNKQIIINDPAVRQKLIEEIENSILCTNPPIVNEIVKTKLQTLRNANISEGYAQNVPKLFGFETNEDFFTINNNNNNKTGNVNDSITNNGNKYIGNTNEINIKSNNNIQNSVQKQTFKKVEAFNETVNQQKDTTITHNVVIHNQQPNILIESTILTTNGSQSFVEEENILNQVGGERLNQPKLETSSHNIHVVCDTPSPILNHLDYIDVTNASHEGATSPGNAFIPTNLPTIQPTHTAPTTVISSFSTATHISAPSEVSQNTAISDRPKVKSVSKNGKNIRKNVGSILQQNQHVIPISEQNIEQSIVNYSGLNTAAMGHEVARDLDRIKNAQSNGYLSINNNHQIVSPIIKQNNQQHSTNNLNSIIDSNTPSTTTFDLDNPLSTATISISSNKEFTRNEQLQLVTTLNDSLIVDNNTSPASSLTAVNANNPTSTDDNAITKSEIFQDEVYHAIAKPIMLSVEDSDRRDFGNTFLNDVEMTMNGVTTWDQLQSFLANKEYCSEYSEFGGILGYASECKMRWEEDNPHNLMEQIMTGNLSSTEELTHHTQSHSITLDSELHHQLHQQLHTQLQNHQVAIERQGCDTSNIRSHPISQTIIVDSDGSNKFEISIESNKIQPPGALQLLFQIPPDKAENNHGGLMMQLQQEELLYLQHKPQQDILRLQETEQSESQPHPQPIHQTPFPHHTFHPQLHKISDLHQQKLLNAQRRIQLLQQQPSHLSQEQQLLHKKKQQLMQQQKILKHQQYQHQQRQPVANDTNQTQKTHNSTQIVAQTSIQQTYQTQVPLNLLQVRKSGSVQLNTSKSPVQQTTDTTSSLAPISPAQKCSSQQQVQIDTHTQNESIYANSVVNDVAPIQILDGTSFTPQTSTNISKRTTDQGRKDRDRFPALRQAPTGSQANTTIAVLPEAKDIKNLLDVNSATDSNNDTALTLACAAGHIDLVNLLLERKAAIEHRDKKGFTPLLLSVTAGHNEIVRKLLDAKSDIEAQSERTKDTALSLACSGGKYEIVEMLIKAGANKEHRNVSDYTPLSLAASGGYINIIKLLLSNGAEINSRTGSKLGISPLMLAAMNGHTAAVKLLLDMGSDINAQIETNRNTALTLACFQGRHEVVSLLLERKAYVEHRAKTGLTPLMEAASGGYIEVGKVLIAKNADVNATPVPSSRDTALTIAADKGHLKFVELLLNHNACVEVKNKKGNSPLWLAAHGGHLSVVQVLHEFGAQIDSQDNRKVSCLMAAFRKGHTKVVKWMVNHVAQFPSDQEMTRYVSTISDTEILEKCQECVSIIRAAKEAQAVKANQIADNLLEELDMESKREENRKAAAARKRERKKLKKMKKKQEKRKLETDSKRNGDIDSEKESQKDDDNDSDKDDDEEDHDDDDDEEEYFSPELNEITDREEPDSGIDANSQGSCESAESKSTNEHTKSDKSKLKNFKNKKYTANCTTNDNTIQVDKELSINNKKTNKQKEVAKLSNSKLLDTFTNEQGQKEYRQNSNGDKMDIGLNKERLTVSNTNNYINHYNKNTNNVNLDYNDDDNDSEEDDDSDDVKYDSNNDDNKKVKSDNAKDVDDKGNNMGNDKNENNDDDYDHAYDDDDDNYVDDNDVANNYDNENDDDVNINADDDDNDDVDNDADNDNVADAVHVYDKSNNRNNKQHNLDNNNIINTNLNVTNNDFRYKDKEIVQPDTLRKAFKKIEVFEQNKPKTNQDYIHVTSNTNSRKSLVFGSSRHQMEHEVYDDTYESTYPIPAKLKNKSFFDDSNVKSQYMTNNRVKREEGWKEVIRKSSMQQQPAFAETAITKVQVPVHAIARVIGRGGSNINAIRATTGAHIEVEKQGKNLSDRWITIKGGVEATKQSHLLITALIKDPDIDILQMMPRLFTNSTKQSASPALSIWDKSNISTPSANSMPRLMVKSKIQQPQNASITNSCNITKVAPSNASVSGKGPSRSTPSAKTYYTSSQSRTVINTNVSNRYSIAENATKSMTTKIPGSIPSFVPPAVFTATPSTTTPTSCTTIMSATRAKSATSYTSAIIALKDTIKNLPSIAGPPGTFASKLSSTDKKTVASTVPIISQHIPSASKHLTSTVSGQHIPPPFVHANAGLQQVQQQQPQPKAIPQSLPSQPLYKPHLSSIPPPEPDLQHEQFESGQSAVQLHQANQLEPQKYSQVEQNEQQQQILQMQQVHQSTISPSQKIETHNLFQPISQQTTNLSSTQQQQSIQLEQSPQNNTIKAKSPENIANKITISTRTITPVSQLSSRILTISPSLHALSCTYDSEFKSNSPIHEPDGGSGKLQLNHGQSAPAYTLFSDSIFNSAWEQLPPVDERKAPGYRPATPVNIKTTNPQPMQSKSRCVNILSVSSLAGAGLQTTPDDITTLHASINNLQANGSNSQQTSLSSLLMQQSESPSNQIPIQQSRIQSPNTQSPIQNSIDSIMMGGRSSMNTSKNILLTTRLDNYIFANQNKNVSSNNLNNNYDNINSDNNSDNSNNSTNGNDNINNSNNNNADIEIDIDRSIATTGTTTTIVSTPVTTFTTDNISHNNNNVLSSVRSQPPPIVNHSRWFPNISGGLETHGELVSNLRSVINIENGIHIAGLGSPAAMSPNSQIANNIRNNNNNYLSPDDIRKIPRPIGTERSWKHGFNIGSGIDQQTDSVIQQQTLQPWMLEKNQHQPSISHQSDMVWGATSMVRTPIYDDLPPHQQEHVSTDYYSMNPNQHQNVNAMQSLQFHQLMQHPSDLIHTAPQQQQHKSEHIIDHWDTTPDPQLRPKTNWTPKWSN